MGFSISWVAVDAACERALFDHFGLKECGEAYELADFPISRMRIGSWYVLQWDHQTHLVDERLLTKLSAHGRLIAVMVEEHVMFASAEEWNGGKRVWGAVHCADVHLMHIGVEGELPDTYADILSQQLQEQEASGGLKAGVDHIIDIPLQLANAIVGYKHDEGDHLWREVEAEQVPKEESAKQRPIDGISATSGVYTSRSKWYQDHKAARPSLLARLFGKRK
jgi:hypothetical protein